MINATASDSITCQALWQGLFIGTIAASTLTMAGGSFLRDFLLERAEFKLEKSFLDLDNKKILFDGEVIKDRYAYYTEYISNIKMRFTAIVVFFALILISCGIVTFPYIFWGFSSVLTISYVGFDIAIIGFVGISIVCRYRYDNLTFDAVWDKDFAQEFLQTHAYLKPPH